MLESGDATILHEMWDDVLQAAFNARFATVLRLYDDATQWYNIAMSRAQRVTGKDTYGTKTFRTLNAAGAVGDRASARAQA